MKERNLMKCNMPMCTETNQGNGAIEEQLARCRTQMARLEIFAQYLLEGEAKAKSILQTAVDGIIIITSRGIIESFNPAAEQIFGWTAREVVGLNISILMPPPHSDRHDDYIQSYLQTGRKKIIGIGREVIGLT